MAHLDMTPSRLEAFSDGVIAIIITIMVLELKVPHNEGLQGLLELWPIFVSYGLSFLMVAVYWINHHHLFHMIKRVNLSILWTNMCLLFSISLIPFFTSYMNEHHMSALSVAIYSGILMICAMAYLLLSTVIRRSIENDAHLKEIDCAVTRKNLIAAAFYSIAVAMAFVYPPISLVLNFIVALMYSLPVFMIEKRK